MSYMGKKRGRPSIKTKGVIKLSDKFAIDFINALRQTDIVIFGELGEFFVRNMKRRKYFNPSTGKEKIVKSRVKIVFEASEQLKNLWKN